MSKKLEYTPRSRIVSLLRRLSLWSRERQKLVREFNGVCNVCGCSKRKNQIEVHHIRQPNWNLLIELIRKELLEINNLTVLCKECHKKETHVQRKKNK